MKRDMKRLSAIVVSVIMASTTLVGCGHENVPQQQQMTQNQDDNVIYVQDNSNNWIPYYLLFNSMSQPNYNHYSYSRYVNGRMESYQPNQNDFDYMKKNVATDYKMSKNKNKNKNQTSTKTPINTNTKTKTSQTNTKTSQTPKTIAPTTPTPKTSVATTPKSSVKSFGGGSTRVSIGG